MSFERIKAGDFHSQTSKWRPLGIRTPVTAVKGRCPGPLDQGDISVCFARRLAFHFLSDNLCEHCKERYFKVEEVIQPQVPLGYLVTTSPQS